MGHSLLTCQLNENRNVFRTRPVAASPYQNASNLQSCQIGLDAPVLTEQLIHSQVTVPIGRFASEDCRQRAVHSPRDGSVFVLPGRNRLVEGRDIAIGACLVEVFDRAAAAGLPRFSYEDSPQ